jgi:N-acetyl-gamma-glutamyl-phosphate reductase
LGGRRVVVDFSGAFRLATGEDFSRWYKLTHPRPDLLPAAHYGLPELFGIPARTDGGPVLVANPGCYPTAALLALAPLLRAGLIEPRGIIVDAKSGVSGAGRQAKEEYSFVELQEDVRAYKLLCHQHTPEIARHLARAAKTDGVSLTFTPHLVPVRRGILATCYARPVGGANAVRCAEALVAAYRDCRFVEVVAPDEARLSSVVGTNAARVGVAADGDVIVAVAAIDNLLKGAAGQAVQTLNRLFGYEEHAGLDHLHRIAP